MAYNASVVRPARRPTRAPAAGRWRDALGVELRTVELTAASWRADLVAWSAHNEYPLTHESSVPMTQIAELARGDGVKVLLSGEGADELFGGYGFLHLEQYMDYVRHGRRWRTAAALAVGKLRRDGLRGTLAAALERLRPGHAAESPDAAAAKGRRLRLHEFPGLVPDGGSSIYDQDWTERAEAAYAHQPDTRRRLEVELLRELGSYLPHLLNRQDKTTMMQSIETRVPFLDPQLVRLALNLPLEVRMEPQRKAPLREIGMRHLPKAIPRRPKIGFGFDARAYLDEAARPEFLLDGRLRDIVEASREGWRAALGEVHDHQRLLLWSGEIWCRLFLEDQPVERVEEELWLATGAGSAGSRAAPAARRP